MNGRDVLSGFAAVGMGAQALASCDPLSTEGVIRVGESAVFGGPTTALSKEMKREWMPRSSLPTAWVACTAERS